MDKYDVIIIGGGPAGMSAALWCAEFDLTSILIESGTEPGGQLHYVYNRIENYPGISATNGDELRRSFLNSLERRRFDLRTTTTVTAADLSTLTISTNHGEKLSAGSIVIATGVGRRKLGVAGEGKFFGEGIMASGAKEAKAVEGKNVVIIGGGDAAIENALILSEKAQRVTVVHRSETFKARKSFLDEARSKQNVSFMTNHSVVCFDGTAKLEKVIVKNMIDESEKKIDCDLALVRIGVEPNTERFRSQLDTDQNGYILVTSRCEASVENVYAIGDVVNPNSLNISTAVGNAASAISHIANVVKREKANPKF